LNELRIYEDKTSLKSGQPTLVNSVIPQLQQSELFSSSLENNFITNSIVENVMNLITIDENEKLGCYDDFNDNDLN
jgi:hypothetical protein